MKVKKRYKEKDKIKRELTVVNIINNYNKVKMKSEMK